MFDVQAMAKTYKENGYVIFERLLSESERLAALCGFHRLFAPSYESWVEQGRPEIAHNFAPGNHNFPWDDSGLNHSSAHPKLSALVEAVMGTREFRFGLCHLNVKYAQAMDRDSMVKSFGFHQDHASNSLGPTLEFDDYSHVVGTYCFEEVTVGTAPTMVIPKGRDESAALPMTAPAGSLILYSPLTFHRASSFENETGYKPSMWMTFCRKDHLWDGSFQYTKRVMDANASIRYMSEATPRQLELIGFPSPGDPLWTEDFLNGMADRYPGFKKEPYLTKLMADPHFATKS